MALGLGAALAGGAILGGLAGAQGQSQTSRRSIGGQTQLGRDIDQMFGSNLETLGQFADVYGMEDVQAGRQGQLDLAAMLQQLSETGGLPSEQDIQTARGQSQNLLAGQRASMQNAFARQTAQANQQAVSMGRSTNDPILQAQMRRQQIEQERELAGQESALTQQISSSLPLQRLGFQQQRAGVLQGMGAQATTLRSNLMGLGTNVQNLQNQIRLGQGSTTMSTPGGLQGALTGAVGGLGSAVGIAGGIQKLF